MTSNGRPTGSGKPTGGKPAGNGKPHTNGHRKFKRTNLPDSAADVHAERALGGGAYQLAFADPEFLLQDEMRGTRLQLEFMKPELALREAGIEATLVVFGSARIVDRETAEAALMDAEKAYAAAPSPATAERLTAAKQQRENSHYYEQARELGRIATEFACCFPETGLVVATGGGPGIMEAANRGAFEAGGKSIGFNISLPHEQRPNAYISPELCFQFHYFGLRKMHFMMRAKALVVFPGGFGTLDELFDVLTLIQTQKSQPVPVILFGRTFWDGLLNFRQLQEFGSISADERMLVSYAESAVECWEIIVDFYQLGIECPL
jgi:uncharacterized protein (TIGR00730 family)